jgi:hypothetical protein
MADKRILLLDGPLLTAHHWHAGHVRTEGEFSPEPVGLEALAAYLKKHRTSIFYLLADTAEEGFQLETCPMSRAETATPCCSAGSASTTTTRPCRPPYRWAARRPAGAMKRSCSPH